MSENEIKSSFIACKIHFKVQFFRQMWLGRTNVFTTIPIWFKSHFVQIEHDIMKTIRLAEWYCFFGNIIHPYVHTRFTILDYLHKQLQ